MHGLPLSTPRGGQDFLDAFAAVAAAVQGTFPRERARQDVFFDVLRSRSSEADDGGDDGEDPNTPPG